MPGTMPASGLKWLVSSSCTGGNCVQVAALPQETTIAVRDSKKPGSVHLYSRVEWNEFLDGIVNGDFSGLGAQ